MELGDLEKQVYKALEKNSIDEVVRICSESFNDGGLHICSIHRGTVLHLAIDQRKYKLAHKLLDRLISLYNNENILREKLTSAVDNWGQTLLHCASVSNKGFGIATRLLRLAPNLLEGYNKRGETPVFSACRNGQLIMFNFLADQVGEYCLQNASTLQMDDYFHNRIEDGASVLHVSILMRTFDLAVRIVERYPNLCKEKGPKGMTPLQMLACCSTASPSGLIPKCIYNIISTKEPSARKLVRILVRNEDCWKHTLENGSNNNVTIIAQQQQQEQDALLLAGENGCLEVVKEILKEHPFAIEQLNDKSQNLLHLVIKNRRMNIYYYLKERHGSSVEWMSRNVDDDGNSILHMVGFLETSLSYVHTNLRSSVDQLSRDLNLLEKLKRECCPPSLTYHQNKMMQTADEMFAKNSKELQDNAREWLDRTTTQGIIVAGLIATVVFAAAYQIPGGLNSKGVPNLLHDPGFTSFINADVASLACAFTSIVLFLCIHTSSLELNQFRTSLPIKLLLSFVLLFISVGMMMVTFAGTVELITHGEKRQTKLTIYTAAILVPVLVFEVSYISLCFQLLFSLCKRIRNKINKRPHTTKKKDEDEGEEAV